MTTYAFAPANIVERTGARPKWLIGDIPETSRPLTDAELAEHGWFPVQEADPIPEGKISTDMTAEKTGDGVQWVHTLINTPQPTLAERRDILISRIEQMRWDKEVGGMNFGGVTIPTDDRAKTLIMGARTAAVEQGEAYSDEWKISPGVYVPLDAATAVALGDALLAHIRASFAREKVLSVLVLEAEDHNTLDTIEAQINNDWPN